MVEKNIKSLLHRHFHTTITQIVKDKHFINSKKELEYFEFKSFFDVVIEFCSSLEPNFIDETINSELEPIQNLQAIYSSLGDVSQEEKKELFKTLFVAKDAKYNELLSKCQEYASKLKEGKIKLQNIKAAKQNRPHKEFYTKLMEIKKRYLSTKEEFNSYQKESYQLFLDEYKRIRLKLKEQLTNILNSRAYMLNKMIWQRANELPAIQAYALKNGIEGYIDAKVFLKHYLQVCDIPTEYQAYKDLVKVLQVLKTHKRKTIAITHDDLQELERMKNALQKESKDFIVKGYMDYKQLLKEKKPEVDLIVIDYHLRGLKEDLEQIKQAYKDCDFLLLFDTKSKDILVEAYHSGLFNPKIKNCMVKPMHLKANRFTMKVNQLL